MTPDGLFADLRERPQWQDEALCAQADPESWYPEQGGSTTAAKQVCMGCPVRAQCLAYALAGHERFGIWGGLSERERRKFYGADGVDVPVTLTPQKGGTRVVPLTPEQETRAAELQAKGWGLHRTKQELKCSLTALSRFWDRNITKKGAAA